jgi:hypothetical protein
MRDRRAIRFGCFALILAFAGCGSPNSGVRGDLRYVGGPAPGDPGSREPGSVVAFAADGSEAASADFEEGKTFELRLEPGTYKLAFTSGDAQCPDRSVAVPSDNFQAIRELCSVK